MNDKHTFIEMYNSSNYDSWEQAWKFGGVYITTVFSVDEPQHGTGFSIMEDVRDAIETACNMMNSNCEIKTRTRIGPVSDNIYIYAKKSNIVKTAELKDLALDWAVAKCEGVDYLAAPEYDGIGNRYEPTDYSTNWAQGGPIIDRESIAITGTNFPWWGCDNGWYAHIGDRCSHGDTPLIAAMRCFVASKLGDEVEVPEQLIPRD